MRTLWKVGALAAALTGLLAAPAVAGGASKPSRPLSYVCLQPLEVCQEAGLKAGSSVESIQQYLRDYETRAASTAPIGTMAGPTRPGRFGFTFSQSGSQFFAWQLSRSGRGRILPFSRCQLLPTGQLVNCVYVGDIGFQARFNIESRVVFPFTTVQNFIENETFMITSAYACGGPSESCTGSVIGPSGLGGLADFSFREFQLRSAGSHDLAFQWVLFDPVTRTNAITPIYDSFDFQCGPFNPNVVQNDCAYPSRQEGDSA